MVTVCQTCGDRGFSVALIYCDKCQAYAVHRYCLYNLPKSFEEYVFWFCVECEPKVVESSTIQQALPATSSQSRLSDDFVGKSKGKNDIKIKKMKKKKKSKNDTVTLALAEVQRQSSPFLPPVENPEKDGISSELLMVGVPNSSEEKLIEAKTSPLNPCLEGSDLVNFNGKAKGKNDIRIKKMKKKKKKSKNDTVTLALAEVQRQSSSFLPLVENPEKDGTSSELLMVGVPNSSEEKLIEAKTSPLNTCLGGLDLVDKGKAEEKNDIKIKKKKRKKKRKSQNDTGTLALVEVQRQGGPFLPPVENLEKDGTSRELLMVGVPNSGEEKVIEAKTSPLNSCSGGLDLVNINGAECVNHNMSIVAINEQLNITRHNFLDPGWGELDGKYSRRVVECGNDGFPINQLPVNVYVPAQPVVESIWRGSFHLSVENLTIGVVAHLSSLACLKVCETANCLPQLLQLELHPRFDVWPKGFKQGGPSDESIALYFFPSDQRDVEIFDRLIYRMMYQDLGIKVAIEDVELLVYSSNVLPLHFQRFQGKFYLWGVFRGKQSSHLTYGVRGEEKNFTKAISCDSHSPVSPLSDHGSHDSKQSLPVQLHKSETSENYQGKNLGVRSKTSKIIGACWKCGSKDHFIKDCPKSGIGATGTCEHCHAYHSGKCWKITGACWKCGSNDHKIRDCPQMVGGGPTFAPIFTSKSISPPNGCGPGRGSAYGSWIPVCEHCHVSHWGKCRKISGACWKCGSKEHFVRNCPEI